MTFESVAIFWLVVLTVYLSFRVWFLKQCLKEAARWHATLELIIRGLKWEQESEKPTDDSVLSSEIIFPDEG